MKPADIPVSLISHLHYDHWAGHSLFPKAEFWIQKDEVAFWTGPLREHARLPQLGQRHGADRPGDAELRQPPAASSTATATCCPASACTAWAATPPGCRS